MTQDELDKDLDRSMNTADHEGYAAAARVRWPEALLDLRESMEQINKLSGDLLRRTKLVEAADRLAWRATDYILAFVRKGPFNCDEPARALIKAMHEYKELRGIEL